jgi:hypothetical protein
MPTQSISLGHSPRIPAVGPDPRFRGGDDNRLIRRISSCLDIDDFQRHDLVRFAAIDDEADPASSPR